MDRLSDSICSDTQGYNTTNSLKTITINKTNPSNSDDSILNILSKTQTFYKDFWYK